MIYGKTGTYECLAHAAPSLLIIFIHTPHTEDLMPTHPAPRALRASLFWVSLVSALLVSAAPAFALPLESFYNTGVDDAGAPIAEGATDTHWETSVGTGGVFVDAINDKNNFCNSCGGIWLDWTNGDAATSRGITHPAHVRDSTSPARFLWRQTFDVPADADPASVTISYSVGFDDRSRNAADDGDLSGCDHVVWLNGTAYPMTSAGSPIQTECVGTIPAGSAFVTGQNTIEFRIANALNTFYGFRLQAAQGTYALATVCGDGLTQGAEACDDGNTADGDGCSATCAIEDGFGCEEPQFVFNGDFELGDTGTGGVLARDPSPSLSLCGAQDVVPGDGFYHVTSSPYHSCTCDGGQGLCLALNGGGGAVWSQTLTGLQPETTYTVSARHALKGENNPINESELNLVVDGVTLASASPVTSVTPIPYETITATFTTAAGQTTAVVEFTNPVLVGAGNDAVLDTISVTGPSVCSPPCGDALIGAGEGCDDGNTDDGDGCSATCAIEAGWSCASEPSACVLLCGDGAQDAGEECDDGNGVSGDGCSATCRDERVSMALYSTGVDDAGVPLADGATDTHWDVSVGGGAFVDALNDKNNFCFSCGDIWLEWPIGDQATSRGITHPDHVRAAAPNLLFTWRQAFTIPADARADTATVTYRVGFDEFSRDATDAADLTGCDHTVWLNGTSYAMQSTGNQYRTECEATIPAGSAFVVGQNNLEFRISNGTTYYGFRLDTISGSFLVNCGDGSIVEGEGCDDGNIVDGDGCSASCAVEDGYVCANEPSTCMVEATCGDGALDAGETCDDSNTTAGDGCSATCTIEDGYVCEGEPSACTPVVEPSRCGDGVIDTPEACDDGDTAAGDGCSATCVVEDGFMCSGEPSMCMTTTGEVVCGDGMVGAGETCDDGNTEAGDGCSETCQKEEPVISGGGNNTAEEGCSCTTTNTPSGSNLWLLGMLVGLFALTRRRFGFSDAA